MRRLVVVILAVVATMSLTVPASAESWRSADLSSGQCGFGFGDGANFYFGSGTYRVVMTSSGQFAQVCQGQLDPASDIPPRAIRLLDFGAPGVNVVITPAGVWGFIDQT